MEGSAEYNTFLSTHVDQLKSSNVPPIYWPALYEKLQKEEFDAGDHFMIQKVLVSSASSDEDSAEDGEQVGVDTADDAESTAATSEPEAEDFTWRAIVYSEEGISPEDARQIYLIDHAWTYKLDEARQCLVNIPGLLQRMAGLFNLSVESKPQAETVEEVLSVMWKYNQSYEIDTGVDVVEAKIPYWYVMDEFGSRIQHSNDPSVRMVPFFYLPRKISYTLMWPVKQLEFEDELTRDYVEYVKDDEDRRTLHLIPWQPYDCSDYSFELGADHYVARYESSETLPSPDIKISIPQNRKGKVYTNSTLVSKFYEPNEYYELVDSSEGADIHWRRFDYKLVDHKSFSETHPHCFVNSFPHEGILTVKQLFYMAMMHYLLKKGEETCWLQETYNLRTELKEFVSVFQKRQKRGDYNTWIVKPCFLGRSVDIQITDNLDYILRLTELKLKIASEYIDKPVLYNQEGTGLVKFDLRYMLLLHTVKPLKAFLHKTFSVRTANRPFSMTDFDDFEKHFTVMNVRGLEYKMIPPEKFVREFEDQYPDHKWSEIEAMIVRCFRLLVEAVTEKQPPGGVGHSPQSRALYGVDVMLKWTHNKEGKDSIQPVILEANSDCNFERQCQARPEFFTDVYRILFTNDLTGVPVVEL